MKHGFGFLVMEVMMFVSVMEEERKVRELGLFGNLEADSVMATVESWRKTRFGGRHGENCEARRKFGGGKEVVLGWEV